jgi:hypothetical protein
LKCPCDLRKKRLHNCKVALESLARAGVPLQDELGACITADHIVDGQRDKILPLLWNIIVYLQVCGCCLHAGNLIQENNTATRYLQGYSLLALGCMEADT